MGLTKRKSTGKWYIRVTQNKKTFYLSTGERSKMKAEIVYDNWKLNKNILLNKNIVLSELTSEVLSYASVNMSEGTCKIYKSSLRNFLSFSGDKALKLFSFKDLEMYKGFRVRSVAPATLNIELRAVKAAFSYAVSWYYLLSNPFRSVRQLNTGKHIPLAFSDYQVNLILKFILSREYVYSVYSQSNVIFYNIILFALYTGCRLDEILSLKWSDINVSGCYADIVKTKTKVPRSVPLPDALMNSLNKYISDNSALLSPFVFPNPDGGKYMKSSVSRKFKRILRLLNFDEKFHFHCLRHTFASKLSVTAQLPVIQDILGHSAITTTKIYIHNLARTKSDAVKNLSYGSGM